MYSDFLILYKEIILLFLIKNQSAPTLKSS